MQLRTHYGFLSYLASTFRHQDPDNLGYIPTQKFFEMTLDLLGDKGTEEDVESMLATREGYEETTVTFSDMVVMFSGKKVESAGDSITMLQYVFELGQARENEEEGDQGGYRNSGLSGSRGVVLEDEEGEGLGDSLGN